MLTDTVGFIRDMPKDLFAAFRATFEEAADADLLLDVVDACRSREPASTSRPRPRCSTSSGLHSIPRLSVYNKVDLLPPAERAALESDAKMLSICALRKDTTKMLLRRIGEELERAGRLPPRRAPLLDTSSDDVEEHPGVA